MGGIAEKMKKFEVFSHTQTILPCGDERMGDANIQLLLIAIVKQPQQEID